MSERIAWQDLPAWVPGESQTCMDNQNWNNIALRGWHYQGQDVIVPAMQDFMIVGYRSGVTPMQRRFGSRWSSETLSPGAASFLTRAQAAHWTWKEPVDVTHLYLSSNLMNDVASDIFEGAISEVVLDDVLRTDDPMITQTLSLLAQEAQDEGVGSTLYIDSLSRALCVHLLRRYSQTKAPEPENTVALSRPQQQQIREFIEHHLIESLTLSQMAAVLFLSPSQFARRFKATFGIPPYAYVIQLRTERARRLLTGSQLSIKTIAADCGFSDQAHLTRLFKRLYQVTPSQFRCRVR